MQWFWKHWNQLNKIELYKIIQLRQAVFIVEQDCPYLDVDGEDMLCFHLCGYQDNELVAYVRVFPPNTTQQETVIGRVITAKSIRGQGWGRPLMIKAEEFSTKEFGQHGYYLGAQAHLENFYASLGYKRCGPNYDEDGIPHLPMKK